MKKHLRLIGWGVLVPGLTVHVAQAMPAEMVCPGVQWSERPPAECGVDGAKLDVLAEALGGRGQAHMGNLG